MTDQNQTVVPPTSQQTQAALKPVGDDLASDIAFGLKAAAAYKKGGTAALLALLPEAEQDAQQTFNDVKTALPTIKAGFKTTEFWLVAGVIIGFVTMTAIGHPIPLDEGSIIGALTAVYASVRTVAKKS